jgi:hypothetical protein
VNADERYESIRYLPKMTAMSLKVRRSDNFFFFFYTKEKTNERHESRAQITYRRWLPCL